MYRRKARRPVSQPHIIMYYPYFYEASRKLNKGLDGRYPQSPPYNQHAGQIGGNYQPIHPAFGHFQTQPFSQSYGMEPFYPYDNNQPYSAEHLLENPLQPKSKSQNGYGTPYHANPYPVMHPYPKQQLTNRPPAGVNSILNSFKTQDGTLDIHKMMDTAGQMMNAVSQVSALVKGLGGIFKV